MKSKIPVKLVWRSVLSFSVALLFMVLFSGSFSGLKERTQVLANGDYEHTQFISEDEMIIKTGPREYYGRWHGPMEIYHEEYKYGITTYTKEEVNMVNGKKHGTGKITTKNIAGNITETYICYNMGQVVDCEKSAINATENLSAYQILEKKYPWYLPVLNTFGFENSYVESFTDTLETVLREYEFEASEFDVYYEEALDNIDETPYDSIIVRHSLMTIYQALEEMKNGDFRLAVIDGYNEGEFNTFASIHSGYFNYLTSLNDSGITNNDFENFCYKFDSLMVSYGELNAADPFFIDSLDTRMFRAMDYISSGETGSEASLIALKSNRLTPKELFWKSIKVFSSMLLKTGFAASSPQVVSETVLFSMFDHYLKSDFIRQAVREGYMMENNIDRLPALATQLLEGSAGNSAMVQGTIVEDGGSEITIRGIVWSESYNPAINNQVINSGTGTGDFSETITGLEAGKTYYARAFAANSAGTAYGNNVRFSASPATGLMDSELSEFKIFPNPATDVVTVDFSYKINADYVFSIVDLSGRVVFQKNLKREKFQGNQLKLNVSNFENGVYNCVLTNGEIQISRKLVVAR